MLRLVAVVAAVLATSSQADQVCGAHAELAGRIMALRQAEAPPEAIDEAVRQAADTLLAADLAARAYAQAVGADADADAREAASYHFAQTFTRDAAAAPRSLTTLRSDLARGCLRARRPAAALAPDRAGLAPTHASTSNLYGRPT